jgi:hypothetical protein
MQRRISTLRQFLTGLQDPILAALIEIFANR